MASRIQHNWLNHKRNDRLFAIQSQWRSYHKETLGNSFRMCEGKNNKKKNEKKNRQAEKQNYKIPLKYNNWAMFKKMK